MKQYLIGYLISMFVLFCIWLPETAIGSSVNKSFKWGEGLKTPDRKGPVHRLPDIKITGDTLSASSKSNTLDIPERSFLRSVGLHFGTFQKSFSNSLEGSDISFGVYQRHLLVNSWFGEARTSLGILKGPNEKIRLIPAEYRINYRFAGPADPVSGGSVSVSPYLYVGAGLLYHKFMEIQRPDDPYTAELEGNLPVSDYWDFESGLTPFLPAGLGLELQLDADTRLDFQLGYHQPLTQLGSYGDSFQKGYLGLNIGIRFGSTVREPAPAPGTGPPVLPLSFQSTPQVSALVPDLPVFPEFRLEAGNIERADPTHMIIERIREPVGSFPVMSSRIQQEQQDRLEFIERVLKYLDSEIFEISGHSDSLGSEPVKRLISESRARAAWLKLVELGVSPDRLMYRGYSDNNPLADNGTPEGRALNRRVELKSIEKMPIRDDNTGTPDLIDFESGEPVYPPTDITFSWLDFHKKERVYERLTRLLELLKHYDQMDLKIGSIAFYEGSSEAYLKEVGKARADKIRAWYIERGVYPERVYTFEPHGTALLEETRTQLPGDFAQLTFLIPEIRQTAQKDFEHNFMIQLGAFSNEKNARRFRKQQASILEANVTIVFDSGMDLYKVLLEGNFNRAEALQQRKKFLLSKEVEDVYIWKLKPAMNNMADHIVTE